MKTRLAADIGADRAALVYEKMMRQVLGSLEELSSQSFAPHLFYDPRHSVAAYQGLLPNHSWPLHAQAPGGLGDRLKQASFELAELKAPFAFIGTDCVDLKAEHFEETLALLVGGSDLVVGPANDGGYYLIALKQPHAALFDGIDWSTDKVFAQTIAKAREAKLSVGLLEMLEDIDDKGALDRHPELLNY
ncbi:MAG: TIGR04282 family arsenosugar biosynthesis glycosyltransferase [Bdellovibrionaceae bacterium]|nr:TIGR04282 family arsenosugar biosynthesis glycosyltransferase [Pseudobdellovibrionaceae bacterium]